MSSSTSREIGQRFDAADYGTLQPRKRRMTSATVGSHPLPRRLKPLGTGR